MVDLFVQPGGRPRLLVSVRHADEAVDALRGGAEIVDVKEPARGALGRADARTVRAIVRTIRAQSLETPISMALGELASDCRHAAAVRDIEGLSFVKMGLAGAPRNWERELAAVVRAVNVPFVAVAYADADAARAPDLLDVARWAVTHGAAGLLVDTHGKQGGSLFAHASDERLAEAISMLLAEGRFVALAGSLRGEDLVRAASLAPAVVAVRGAACRNGDRGGSVSARAVAACSALVKARAAHVSSAGRGAD